MEVQGLAAAGEFGDADRVEPAGLGFAELALALEEAPFDGAETVAGEFDLIVSNPPYLTGAEMAALQPEVAYEPAMALYGEDDGLFFYRKLSEKWASRLKKGSVMAFEVGDAQGEEVAGIFRDAGFDSICQKRDLHGIIRVVSAKRPLEG
mgnify:CR=1 FL=1